MIMWQKFFLLAFIGFLAVADAESKIRVDFPENVNALQVSRIVSGWPAELGQWAHQVSLRMSNSAGQVSGCGGSVVHREWVLTAAHCTASRVVIIIRAGLVNLTQPEYMTESDEWYNHPSFNDNLPTVVQHHDISLLKLKTRLTFTDNLQPIRIQRSFDMNRDYSGQQLVASGYGLTWTLGVSPEVLNWVYLRGVSNAMCFGLYGALIDDSTICATYFDVTSQSTCQGDSGGPLIIIGEDNKLTLIGVTSFVSAGGCHVGDPAGFIRPGHYHPWYLQVTGIDFDVDSLSWSEEESSSESSSSEAGESNEDNNDSNEEVKGSSEEGKDSNEDVKDSNEGSKDSNEDENEGDKKSEEDGNSTDSNESDNGSNVTELESSEIKDILNDKDIKAQIGALFIAKLGGQINIENVNFYVGKRVKHNLND